MFNNNEQTAHANPAAKKFVYDPSSMLLPHEKFGREQAQLDKLKHLGPKNEPSSPHQILRAGKGTPASRMTDDMPTSSSPPESHPPPYSEVPSQSMLHNVGNASQQHAGTSSPADRVCRFEADAGISPRIGEQDGENARMQEVEADDGATESPALLSDWEVVETLGELEHCTGDGGALHGPLLTLTIFRLAGTGTFGRVLLVRLRPPYRSTSYHPIFPSLKYAPGEAGEPSPEQTAYADAQLPHYAMKVLAKSEIVRLKQVEHINSERAILERVRHPFLVEL